ncbi:MAG TPA: nucleotidyltransferase family protein [bacterium]|nr:nucleotidyltransferase family protein [bacterium]
MTAVSPRIGAVILAAGPSKRMGRPKLLLSYRGVPLLRRAVDAAVAAGCEDTVVVLGAEADQYRAALDGTPARILVNPHFAEGMSGSIQVGIEAMSDDVVAAVIILADQPFIDAGIIRSLIEKYQSSGKKIVASQYGDIRGVPALFDRALFLELLVVTGDLGARTVIETYPGHVATVEIPVSSAEDIDTPEDAERLLKD